MEKVIAAIALLACFFGFVGVSNGEEDSCKTKIGSVAKEADIVDTAASVEIGQRVRTELLGSCRYPEFQQWIRHWLLSIKVQSSEGLFIQGVRSPRWLEGQTDHVHEVADALAVIFPGYAGIDHSMSGGRGQFRVYAYVGQVRNVTSMVRADQEEVVRDAIARVWEVITFQQFLARRVNTMVLHVCFQDTRNPDINEAGSVLAKFIDKQKLCSRE